MDLASTLIELVVHLLWLAPGERRTEVSAFETGLWALAFVLALSLVVLLVLGSMRG